LPNEFTISGRGAAEIAASVERAVRRGDLHPGERLPTIRALAADLGVSPVTVAAAYRRLRGRGLVSGGGRAGTRVAAQPPLPVRQPPVLPAGVRDLSDGNPDPALLPRLPRLRPAQVLYGTRSKDERLVELLRDDFASDGIDAESLAIVAGALDGIERVLAAHLRPGDRIALEDPGFTRVHDLIAALGLAIEPVAVDQRGARPESLRDALERGVAAVILTPRAQNPTGAAIDRDRASELRRVLSGYPHLLVIEDDYAGSVAGITAPPIAPVREQWAVVRSTSKALGPDLRLAALAGDAATVARVEGRQMLGTGWVSHILQRMAAELLAAETTRARVARAAATYTARRQALIAALADRGIVAWGRSGLNVWIPVTEEAPAVQTLLNAGWAVAAGERFRLNSPPAIRVTAARLAERDAPRFAAALAASLGTPSRTHTA
jgi:DNA-binding transcriptional MocR family regulator